MDAAFPLLLPTSPMARGDRLFSRTIVQLLITLAAAGCWQAAGSAPPSGADRTVSLAEDTVYTLNVADFGFTDAGDDPPDRFVRFELTQAPDSGVLRTDGFPASTGDFISLLPVHGAWAEPDTTFIGWSNVVIPSNDSKMLAIGPGRMIHLSSDAGKTWVARGEARPWTCLAASADGTRIVAAALHGHVHVSHDAGVTWTQHLSPQIWIDVVSSADGSVLAAIGWNISAIFISRDAGATWHTYNGVGTSWNAITISDDGVRLAATSIDNPIHVSTDSGITWQSRGPAHRWNGELACSADGGRLVSAAESNFLVSTDFGASWVPQAWAPSWGTVQRVASSADGSILVAGTQVGLYSSSDYGTSWTRRSPLGYSDSVAVSKDGSFAAAVQKGPDASAHLFTSRIAAPVLTFTPQADASGSPPPKFRFRVGDDGAPGSNLDLVERTMTLEVTPVNDAPSLVQTLPELIAPKDTEIGQFLTAPFFTDPDNNSEFTFTASLVNGRPWPAWLLLDPPSGTLSGMPGNGDKGILEISLTATDTGDPPLSGTGLLRVIVPHEAPTGTDRQVVMDEDTSYIFGPDDFGFSDPNDSPPNTFSRIKLARQPGEGNLTVDGREISSLTEISMVPDISWGWTPRAAKQLWTAIACSADGRIIVATASVGNIHLSNDAGESWSLRESARRWNSVACSADGTTMVAAASDDHLYVSVDAGASWTPRAHVGRWGNVAVSADGTRLLARNSEGWLVTSRDSGTTWNFHRQAPKINRFASSADGLKLIAIDTGQNLLTSTDFGSTWIQRDENRLWSDVATSADGRRLLAVGDRGRLLAVSEDAGAHWSHHIPPRPVSHIVCSASGQRIIGWEQDLPPQVSYDGGRHWAIAESIYRLQSVALSADGKRLAATDGYGYLYTTTEAIPKLVFTPKPGGFGPRYATIRFQVGDDGAGDETLDPAPKTITCVVNPINDPPVPLDPPIPASLAREYAPFSYKPAGGSFSTYFADDGGSSALRFQLFQADGAPLPAWLTFNPATQTLSGTPGTRDVGFLSVRVVATDNGNPPLSASSDFLLRVHNVDEPPVGAPGSVAMLPNTTHLFRPEDFGFTDPRDFPPHPFTRIKLTTLPAAGTLTLDGAPAIVGASAALDPLPAGIEWTEHNESRQWKAIATSADGARLVAVASGSPIHVSNDFGTTWSQREIARNWSSVASSADGFKLLASDFGGFLYTSDDGGASWAPRHISGSWVGAASSADGTRFAAVAPQGGIIISTDSGATWSTQRFAAAWSAISMSADGTTLVAVPSPWNPLWISHDGGATWASRGPKDAWHRVALSSDGRVMYAAAKGGGLHASTDSGHTWRQVDGQRQWSAVAVSADGRHVLTAVDDGPLLLSPDAGRTWQPRGNAQRWSAVSASADGSHLAAVVNPGRIYTSRIVPASSLAFTPALDATGVPYTSFTFQVEDAGTPGANIDADPKLFSLEVRQDASTPFAQWAGQRGLPDDPSAHDGAHLLSFAFGLEPSQISGPAIAVDGASIVRRGYPTLSVLPPSLGPGYGVLFGRRNAAALRYSVELSHDLTHWEPVIEPPWVLAADGLIEACFVPFPVHLSADRPPRFLRIAVAPR